MTMAARKSRLAPMAPAARLALVTASAERLLPIYEKHWVGDHSPYVARAVALGWAKVRGEPVDASEVANVIRGLDDLVNYLNEQGLGVLSHTATVALRVVECLGAVTDEAAVLAAARGLGNHLSIGVLLDGAMAGGPRPPESADAEERRWVEDAFVAAASGATPEPALFAAVGSRVPGWWSAYEQAPNPLR